MKKSLLMPLIISVTTQLGYTSDQFVIDSNSSINVTGGEVEFSDYDNYLVTNGGSISVVSYYSDNGAKLTVTKPVVVGSNGTLEVSDNIGVCFEDTLTINNGYLYLYPYISSSVQITVKNKLILMNAVNGYSFTGGEISIQKGNNGKMAIFDISNLSTMDFALNINGNNETLLECCDLTNITDGTDFASVLTDLSKLKNIETSQSKSDVITQIRNTIQSFLGTSAPCSNVIMTNMKIQDYYLEKGQGNTTVVNESGKNKIEYEIGDISTIATLIKSDATTLSSVTAKSGLTLVDADSDGMFDFYSVFNSPGNYSAGNDITPNSAGNIFTKWSANYQLPLSNETSNNTDFEFKTDINPSSGNERDLSITGGEQNIETVKFTGDNSSFINNIILNGSLKNVEFACKNSYVNIDASNISNDVTLAIQNGSSENIGQTTIKKSIVLNNNQKIAFSIGQYNNVTFSSDDNTERTYCFDNFYMGHQSTINVGNSTRQGITLVL